MLPDRIRDMAQFAPAEDVIVPLLRDAFPDLRVVADAEDGDNVQTLIENDQTFPLLLVRRGDSFGQFNGDDRFIDSAHITIHAFCEDPDGDQDAALLCDAARITLRDAWTTQKVVPGRGHISGYRVLSVPHRVTDWDSAAGPVQHADLPTGVHRYEARFALKIRKPRVLSL